MNDIGTSRFFRVADLADGAHFSVADENNMHLPRGVVNCENYSMGLEDHLPDFPRDLCLLPSLAKTTGKSLQGVDLFIQVTQPSYRIDRRAFGNVVVCRRDVRLGLRSDNNEISHFSETPCFAANS